MLPNHHIYRFLSYPVDDYYIFTSSHKWVKKMGEYYKWKELMTLCGARSGVRFESDLLERLTIISCSIQAIYKELSDMFSAMPSEEKKLVYNSSNAFLEGSRTKSFIDKVNELSFIIAELQSIVRTKRSTIAQGQKMSAVKDPDGLPAGTGASRPAWF